MQSDGYGLFTECHRLYVSGVRLAVRERLESVYGGDWWNKGVLSVISPEQRQQLERIAKRESPDALEVLLDAPHFGAIICRTSSFADAFNDQTATFRKFRRLGQVRNAWAHVQMDSVSLARVMQSLETMEDILASLRRREALDIERIRREFSEQSSIPSDTMHEILLEEGDMLDIEDFDSGYASDERTVEPLTLWSHLQSYLSLDTIIEMMPEPEGTAQITLRVSNNAPKGQNLPNLHFHDVLVRMIPEGRNRLRNISGISLAPGDTIEDEVNIPVKLLPSIEFSLEGRLDQNSLFNFRRKLGLPSETVKPILDEFVVRFESLGIKELLQFILESIANANATMTLQEAAQLRKGLQDFQPVIQEKISGIDQLSGEFMLQRGSTLQVQCVEVNQFLRSLTLKITSLDEAISQTDPESIAQAVNELEQSQLAITRLENTIKDMANPAH